MSKIIPISITTTEQAVTLDATYQFVWLRNMGENDCLLSDHSGIVAGDDNVTLVKAGESGRIATSGRAVYIKAVSGTSTGEIHAQNFSDAPFKSKAKRGGSGTSANIYRTTTALTDGATTNPITVDGNNVTAVSGDFAVYNTQEFLFDGTQWNLLGDRVGLGDLAYKDTADTTYTPAGTVSTPTVTVAKETTTVNSITAVGTLPSLVYNENTHMYSLSQGALPTKGADTTVMTNATATSTQPTFTGTEATIEVD